jgi:SAM-dependent methyltransferase
MSEPSYLADRRVDLHARTPWTQFAFAEDRLRAAVRRLIDATVLTTGSSVGDLGCGEQPYRSELPPGVHYAGIDLPGNPRATVTIGPDGSVPLPDCSLDLVLCNQVLEHAPDPGQMLDECHRLLRQGGSLILSTHGIMYYHQDPEDYWRWTRVGLEKVVRERGFDIADTVGVLGLGAAALQLFQDGTVWRLPRFLRRAYVVMMQVAIRFVDSRYSDETRRADCLTIVVRAVRHEDSATSLPDDVDR